MLDGAMGTALYSRGYFINRAFDEANATAPEKVFAVHESHIAAGADVIETNTFSANRCMLAKYGAQERLEEINREGFFFFFFFFFVLFCFVLFCFVLFCFVLFCFCFCFCFCFLFLFMIKNNLLINHQQ